MAIQHLHVFGLFVKQGIDIENVFSVGRFSVLIEFWSCFVFVVADQFNGFIIEGCSEFGCRQRIAHGGAYVEAAMGIPTKVPKLPVLRVISCKQLPVRPFGLMLVGKSFGV